jgi:hypothetical protein
MQKAQMGFANELKLQEMKSATAIEVARIGAAKAQLDPAAEAAEERLATGLEMAHDVGMEAMKQQHEKELSAQEHAQSLEQGQQSATVAAAQQAGDQAHQTEMAQQAQEAASQNGGGNE